MATHNIIGKKGEEIAKKYLEDKGYKIIECNYKTKRSEIDIITQYKNTLVFVEVRTKRGERYGTPEETIDYKKRMRLKQNAAAYIHRRKYNGFYRIDAMCLLIDENQGLRRIDHYENIVED